MKTKTAFDHFDNISTVTSETSELRKALDQISKPEGRVFWASANLIQVLKTFEIDYLEKSGVIITAFNKQNPHGSYALGYLTDPADMPSGTVFRLSRSPITELSIQTIPAQTMTAEQLATAAFEHIPTKAQIISVFSDGKWGNPQLIPAARFCVSGMTTTSQYAQSAFEGMVAQLSSDKDKASVFRPQKNAQRFNRSLSRIGIPELPDGIFIDSITQAVLANREYIPAAESPARLYIRPYAVALDGGARVSPATKYLFAVQVFPFCSYTNPNSPGLNIATINGTERAVSGTGNYKVSANYAPTLVHNIWAHQGKLPEFPGRKFDGVFYTSKHPQGGENIIDEYAAANLFFIKEGSSALEIYTPNLIHNRILPGITRESIITLLKLKGFEVKEVDITVKMAAKMSAAFVTGSAVGITIIASMAFDPALSVDFAREGKAKQLILSLKSELEALRAGDASAHTGTEVADWPLSIKLS